MLSVTFAEQADLSDIYTALETIAVRTRSQGTARIRKFTEHVASDGVWKTPDKLATEVGALLSWKFGADGDDKKKGQPNIATIAAILGDSETITWAFAELVDEARYLAIAQPHPSRRSRSSIRPMLGKSPSRKRPRVSAGRCF